MSTQNKKILITVITVCFNAEKFIEKTINSVLEQTYENIEYIIKDGESTDRTNEIIISYADKFEQKGISFRHIVGKDSGIYDAMNDAVEKAGGQYVHFLNAGDYFTDNNVLKNTEVFVRKTNADVAYGDITLIDGERQSLRKYKKVCSKKAYFISGDCICHQAMFAKRKLFVNKKFDLSYKVCADKEWQLSQISTGKKFMPMNFVVASVLVDGFSASHLSEFEEETKRCVDSYIKSLAWVYDIINRMKHNAVMVKILRAVGNVFFTRGSKKDYIS